MNIEFKKGFNWTIGAITGVTLAVIVFILATTTILGFNELFFILGDFIK